MPFPSLLLKPLDLVTPDDVTDMLGWPETSTVEYKGELPGRDGHPDAWLRGGKVEGYARDKLFKEVVAFANSAGGHLLLGVEEAEGTLPTAGSIRPIPRCADLAERLARMAQSIDPPIPLLLVRGVPTDGDAGLVIFSVPQSRSAPHRSTDRECYVRRGTESVPISMREIREMIYASERRAGMATALFERASRNFSNWLATPIEGGLGSIGFRITAVPVGAALELGRLYARRDLVQSQQSYPLLSRGRRFQAYRPYTQERSRPIVRGVRWTYDEDGIPTYLDLHSNGMVDFGVRDGRRENGRLLAVGWVLGGLIHVLHMVQRLRTEAGTPDCEYAVQVELDAVPRAGPVQLLGLYPTTFGDLVGQGLQMPLTLASFSFGPMSELDQALSTVMTDIYDAAGERSEEPMTVALAPN